MKEEILLKKLNKPTFIRDETCQYSDLNKKNTYFGKCDIEYNSHKHIYDSR